MSRIGRRILNIPNGTTVEIKNNNYITVRGPKGELNNKFSEEFKISITDNTLQVERPNELPKIKALHGTINSILENMLIGVSEGFKKNLELIGVGYRVAKKEEGLTLSLGYSHPIEIAPIKGIKFEIEGNNKISVQGIDKQLVGQVAADIRSKREPEPYKGKGVKYSDEVVRRKEGKKA